MLLHLDDELFAVATFNPQGLVNFREHLFRILSLGVKVYIDNRTDDLGNASYNL